MATDIRRICCFNCSKDKAPLRCEGCLQEFCYIHLGDHRQELEKQLDDIELSRDLFRQTLTEQLENTKTDTLMKTIDEWEHNSIKQIQQTAEETRQELLKNINRQRHEIEIDLNQLTDQLRESRQEQDFNEIGLHQFQEELKQLTNKLTKLSNISVQKDSTLFISNIRVDLSGLFTFNSSKLNDETSTNNSQQTSITDQMKETTTHNMSAFPNAILDPPTSVSEQSSSFNEEQEEDNAPASSTADSLLSKKVNTTSHKPNSPLYTSTTFEELNLKPDLLKGISSMGFQSPSKIQAMALPSLLSDPPRNIIAQSQSGTGKTAAFSLAIISRIDPSLQYPQALILAPTFELAIQIGSMIEKMAQFLPYIQIAYAVSDSSPSNKANFVRNQLLSQPIVVGAPGTVEDWWHRRRVIDLSKLRICCVDEADLMIASGDFQHTCVNLVNGLNHATCQMMLFSATYSDEVMAVARQMIQNPVVLRLKRDKQMLDNIYQYFIRCFDSQEKYYAIQQIYASLCVGKAMVFCGTKATALELSMRMVNDGHSVREFTSALDIEQRASIIKQFRDGVFRVLISTNIAVRGLDSDDVSLVINYDMPVTMNFQPDYGTYLHRIGRCGRFGKIGYAFNLIGLEKDLNTMKQIEEYFSHPIKEITIEGISQLKQDEE